MNMTAFRSRLSTGIFVLATLVILAACGGSAATTAPGGSVRPSSSPAGAIGASDTPASNPTPGVLASEGASQAPDTGGGTTFGDVPDNAVFLTYHQAGLGFDIQYVEGWQVTTQPDGVVIRDKDSSETVAIGNLPADLGTWISSTDLPALHSQAGFKLVKQDTVKVAAATYDHVVYHILSPADPVTGKQIPSTVDRYYVPGPSRLAVVSLSTPDGVDNVDAFRQMVESFKWH